MLETNISKLSYFVYSGRMIDASHEWYGMFRGAAGIEADGYRENLGSPTSVMVVCGLNSLRLLLILGVLLGEEVFR